MTKLNCRKCKNCEYFLGGWCHWLGKPRNPKNEECEDGYKKKDNIRIHSLK